MAVSVKQDFGVGLALEIGASGDQIRRQGAEVVYRAVEDDPQRSVRRDHRLSPGVAEIEDGEAPMAEGDTLPARDAFAVGPPPGQRADHVSD